MLGKQTTRHMVAEFTTIRLDIQRTKLHHPDLRGGHRRVQGDRLPGKIYVHDKRQADTLVASVCKPTEEMAFEADGQHMHTGRVHRFLLGDSQYALGCVLGVQKILLLELPPRE
jgi:hypothetical protein